MPKKNLLGREDIGKREAYLALARRIKQQREEAKQASSGEEK